MKYKVTLNGKIFEVEVEKGDAIIIDEYEACVPATPAPAAPAAAPVPVAAAPAAPASAPAAGANDVPAPLPGTVLSVAVKAGQTVKSGDLLVVIEAMKMENEVLSPKDGTITAVMVNKGSAVQTGDAICSIA